MINTLSWITKKHRKISPRHYIQSEENSRTFQGFAQKFKDFSRKNGIQDFLRMLRTLTFLDCK